MEGQSYYRNTGQHEDIGVSDKALVVNCTGLSVLERPFRTRNLSGRRDYYFQYLCRGRMSVSLGGEDTVMEPGQFIVYPPGTPYFYSKLSEETVCYYWVHFTGSEAGVLLADCGIPLRSLAVAGVDDKLINIFNELFGEFIRRDAFFDAACASLLYGLAAAAGRALTCGGRASRCGELTASLEYIHSHFNSPISVERLASLEHLSAGRFRTLFRSRTGCSPCEYLTSLRVSRACELISQTDMALREVAEACGYPDQLYFSRVFRRRLGIPPTTYKNGLRVQPEG